MTIQRFKKIARQTSDYFWIEVYLNVTKQEKIYLHKTPAARRNLEKRFIRALAETLLSPDQISKFYLLDLEDPQDDIPDAESGLQTEPKELTS